MIPIKYSDSAKEKHWEMLSKSISRKISEVISNNGDLKIGKSPNIYFAKASDRLLTFLTNLNSSEKLKNYLHLNPTQLIQKIREFEYNLPDSIERRKKVTKHSDDFKILKVIFQDSGYEHDSFIKLNFINSLNLETCPYCNRNYIYCLDEEGKIKPQIDHFYPKSIYPFLAASFYNLIPSCETCNGFGGKGSEDTFSKNVINPYLLEHKDFRFSYDIISLSLINPISSKGSIKVTLQEKEDKNAELFKLEELYEKHEDHVLELIYKSQIQYSEKYREHLNKFNGLHFSKSEIDRMIIGNYAELDELHKRPLSKLYRDIAIELGLITPN